MIRRFCFIIGVIILILVSRIEAQQGQNQGFDSLTFLPLFTPMPDQSAHCYRIPAMVVAPNGDLLVAVDERVSSCLDLKWSDDINIVIRRSKDGGKSWTEIEKIVDFPIGMFASDPSMIVDQENGVVFLFYNFMNLEKEPNVYCLHVMKSTDNGGTWTGPENITTQITKPGWHKDFKFITSGRGIHTRDGCSGKRRCRCSIRKR